jgi:hypothetical protein
VTAKVWIRCIVISLIATAMVPPLTLVAMAPAEGEEVVDLRTADRWNRAGVSEAEMAKRMESPPMRRVTGLERFTYWFTEPLWFLLWWPQVTVWFLLFLASTVSVSYLNGRAKRGT